jgi:hypothetical protein
MRSPRVAGGLPAAALGLAAFAVYAYTAFPSVTGGDNPQLIMASATLGIAHPPGYPLFTMAGWLFSHLMPFGSVAYRINLLSGLFGALSVWLLALAARHRTGSEPAAVLAAGLYAFSPLVWSYSDRAEVFTLNALLLSLLYYVYARWASEEQAATRHRWELVGAACAGLAMSNHHLSALNILVVMAAVLPRALAHPRPVRHLAALLACFAAGLLPYAYLPLAYSRGPQIVWGDFSTLDGFLRHLLRSEYGSLSLSPNPSDAFRDPPRRLLIFAATAGRAFLWLGLPLAVLGALRMRLSQHRPSLEVVAGASAALYLLVFSLLANHDLNLSDRLIVEERFWLQPLLAVALLTASGLSVLRLRGGGWLATATAVVSMQLLLGWSSCNHHSDSLLVDYARAALVSVEKNALVISRSEIPGDGMRYLNTVERLRPDVEVIPSFVVTASWGKRTELPAFALANLEHRPVYFSNHAREPRIEPLGANAVVVPFGMLRGVVARRAVPTVDHLRWRAAVRSQFEALGSLPDTAHLAGWEKVGADQITGARNTWLLFDRPPPPRR